MTLDAHLTDVLNMTQLKSDLAMYIWSKDSGSGFTGVSCTYVDDCLNADDEDFQRHTEAVLHRFDSKPRVINDFDFYGVQVNTQKSGQLTLSVVLYRSAKRYPTRRIIRAIPERSCSAKLSRSHSNRYRLLCKSRRAGIEKNVCNREDPRAQQRRKNGTKQGYEKIAFCSTGLQFSSLKIQLGRCYCNKRGSIFTNGLHCHHHRHVRSLSYARFLQQKKSSE